MLRPLLLAVALAVAAPPAGAQTSVVAPTAQLAASVQRTLDVLGFREVDAASLTTRQLAALHLNVRPRAPGFGSRWIDLRQEVKVILGWDGYALRP